MRVFLYVFVTFVKCHMMERIDDVGLHVLVLVRVT